MCGIAGWLFRPELNMTRERRVIMATAMALHMEARGKQSWGVYRGDNGGIIKDTGSISWGFNPELVADSNLMLLHTRHASVGAVTQENAHPWRFTSEDTGNQVVGVHNGGIGDRVELNEKYDRGFEVDSQHFFQHVADGLDVTKLRGYGAVAYTFEQYRKRGSIPHIRLGKFNNGSLEAYGILGPSLVRGGAVETQAEKEQRKVLGMVFASTPDACRAAIKMSGVKYEDYIWYKVEPEALYEIRDNPQEDSMFFFSSRKGLDLSYYNKSYNATQGGGTRAASRVDNYGSGNWAERKLRPSTFVHLQSYEIANKFVSLGQYHGFLTCCKCSYVAQLEYRPTTELFCSAHWLQLVNERDERVVYVNRTGDHKKIEDAAADVAEKLAREVRNKSSDAPTCGLCPDYGTNPPFPALYISEGEHILVCQVCHDKWVDEEKFLPLDAGGKAFGDDEEEEVEEEVLADSTPEVVVSEKAKEEDGLPKGKRLCSECGKTPTQWRMEVRFSDLSLKPKVTFPCDECIEVLKQCCMRMGARIASASTVMWPPVGPQLGRNLPLIGAGNQTNN